MIKTFIIYNIIDICLDKLSDVIESNVYLPMLLNDQLNSDKSELSDVPKLSDFIDGKKFHWLRVNLSREYDPSTNIETIKYLSFLDGDVRYVTYNGVFHTVYIRYTQKFLVVRSSSPTESSTQKLSDSGVIGLSLESISGVCWE